MSYPKVYRVLLADDHPIFREGLKKLLEEKDFLQIVGEANNEEEILEVLRQKEVDLILLDISLKNRSSGLEALKKIKEKYPTIKVLILTMHRSQEMLERAIYLGAEGYILKEEEYPKLLRSIKKVLRGEKAYSYLLQEEKKSSKEEIFHSQVELLTPREKEIISFLQKGYTAKEIGKALSISPRTVEVHKNHILKKFQVHSTLELLSLFRKYGY